MCYPPLDIAVTFDVLLLVFTSSSLNVDEDNVDHCRYVKLVELRRALWRWIQWRSVNIEVFLIVLLVIRGFDL